MSRGIIFEIGAVLLAVSTICWDGAAASDRLSDPQIKSAVRDLLRADIRVKNAEIDVSAMHGWVTLRGTVESYLEKHQAEQVAKKVPGVRGVMNMLNVRLIARLDAEIAEDVGQRLRRGVVVAPDELQIVVENGVVTLVGQVGTWAQRCQAERIVRETRGVKTVQNHLTVTAMSRRSDQQIQDEVEAKLSRDVYLSELQINVTVAKGIVTLTGEVNSLFQKDRAEEEVQLLVDVRGVENRLTLLRRTLERETPFPHTDEDVQRFVSHELQSDPRVDAPSISVSAVNGVIVLHGSVATLRERQIAERVARNIVGVMRVDNQLKIRAASRSDREIQQDLLTVLQSDSVTGRQAIDVAVRNGVVVLSGEVTDFMSKMQAVRLAARIGGVQSIDNHLKVAVQLSDPVVTQRVVERLKTNGATKPIADRIHVKTDRGIVTLTGTVGRRAESSEAERLALVTDGVRRVDNQLKVTERDEQ